MKSIVKKELDIFRNLQEKYDTFGAMDSEPDAMFHVVIGCALGNKPLDFKTLPATSWQLYSSKKGWKSAARALTKQAQKLYKVIRKQEPNKEDIKELKDIAWRYGQGDWTTDDED